MLGILVGRTSIPLKYLQLGLFASHHERLLARRYNFRTGDTIKFFHGINYFDLFNVAYLLSYERCSCERVAIYLIAGLFILTVPSLKD